MKSLIWETNLLQYISSWGEGRTASWQQGSKERAITRSNKRAQPIKVFFRWKARDCQNATIHFLEGLSMLTVVCIKTSLKQTSRKKLRSCSVCVYVLTARRQLFSVWCPSASYTDHYVRFYAILEIIGVHILTQFLFALIENKSLLSNNWEN